VLQQAESGEQQRAFARANTSTNHEAFAIV
jgi:hypothetical protein